jgi:hypothetical protein
LALSPLATIFSRSRDLVLLSRLAGLAAVGGVDGEDQRLRILEQDAATPDRGDVRITVKRVYNMT